jgi:hypothetical protein
MLAVPHVLLLEKKGATESNIPGAITVYFYGFLCRYHAPLLSIPPFIHFSSTFGGGSLVDWEP